MAKEDEFIVAIELGSSKVTGLAGKKHPDGVIQVLAFHQEPSASFIRKGRIYNFDKMTQCAVNIKEKLEKRLQKSINRVYVGLGGMGMHTVGNTVVRHFTTKEKITHEIVDSINDENLGAHTPERDILDTIPQEYRIGPQTLADPVGVLAESIEGHFLNVMASSTTSEQIRKCFREARLDVADMPITVMELANAMLTEPEKRSGCVFVDMGAETTSVAIYKNNLLRHLAVIPLGGANVTKDLTSLQIEEDEAEQLKLKYGEAYTEPAENDLGTITLRDGRNARIEEIRELIEARMEEIILNIGNQISLSKFDANQLIAGLVITGGAAQMKSIEKAFNKHTGFEKMRFIPNVRLSLRGTKEDFNRDGSYNAALALLDKPDLENCCGGELGMAQPDFFDEKAKEEEERKRLEEARQAEAEAAAEAERRAQEEQQAEEERREAERQEQERLRREKKEKRWAPFKKILNKLGDLVADEDENK